MMRLIIVEKWSRKYKRSIDCAHPKGFSQRAHCQGRKKKKLEENTIRIVIKENIPEEEKGDGNK